MSWTPIGPPSPLGTPSPSPGGGPGGAYAASHVTLSTTPFFPASPLSGPAHPPISPPGPPPPPPMWVPAPPPPPNTNNVLSAPYIYNPPGGSLPPPPAGGSNSMLDSGPPPPPSSQRYTPMGPARDRTRRRQHRRIVVRAEDLKAPKCEELRDWSLEELLSITDYDLYKRQRTHLENMRKKEEYLRNLEAAISEFPPLSVMVKRKVEEGEERRASSAGPEGRGKSPARGPESASSTAPSTPASSSAGPYASLTGASAAKALLPKLHLPPSPFLSLSTPNTPSHTRTRSASPSIMLRTPITSLDTEADLERRQLNYFESTFMYKAESAMKDARIAAAREVLEQLGVWEYLRRVRGGERGVEVGIVGEVRGKMEELRKLRREVMGGRKEEERTPVVERPRTPEILVVPPREEGLLKEPQPGEDISRPRAGQTTIATDYSKPERIDYFPPQATPSTETPTPEEQGKCPINKLPPELLIQIFTYIYPTFLSHSADSFAVALTCRRWYEIMTPLAYRVVCFGENYEEVRESLSASAQKREEQEMNNLKSELRRRRRSEERDRQRSRGRRRGTSRESYDGEDRRRKDEKEDSDYESDLETLGQGTVPMSEELQRQLKGRAFVRVKPGNMCLVGMKSTIGILSALQSPHIARHVREIRYMATSAHAFPNQEVLDLYKGTDVRYAIDLRNRANEKMKALARTAVRLLVNLESATIEGGSVQMVNLLLGVLKWSPKLSYLKISNINLRCLDLVRGRACTPDGLPIPRNRRGKKRLEKGEAKEDTPSNSELKVTPIRPLHPNLKCLMLSCLFYSHPYKDTPRTTPHRPSWLRPAYLGARKLANFIDTLPELEYLEIDGSDIPIEPVLNCYFVTVERQGKKKPAVVESVRFPQRNVPKPPSPIDYAPIYTGDFYTPGYSRGRYAQEGAVREEKELKGRRLKVDKLKNFNVAKMWIVNSKKDLKSVPGDWISSPGWEEVFLRLKGLERVGFHGGILNRHLSTADQAFNRVASHIGRTLTHLTIIHDTSFKPMHTRSFYPDIPYKPHSRGLSMPRLLALLRHMRLLTKFELGVIYPGVGMRHVLAIAECLKGERLKNLHVHLVHDVLTLPQAHKLAKYLPNIERLTLNTPIPFVPGAVFNVAEDAPPPNSSGNQNTTSTSNEPHIWSLGYPLPPPLPVQVNTGPNTFILETLTYLPQLAGPSSPLATPPGSPSLGPTTSLPPVPGSAYPPPPALSSQRRDKLASFDLDLLLRALSPLRKLKSLTLPYVYPVPLELADIHWSQVGEFIGYMHVNGVEGGGYAERAERVKREYLRAVERVGRGVCGRGFTVNNPSSSSNSRDSTTGKEKEDKDKDQSDLLFPNLEYFDIKFFSPEEPLALRIVPGAGWYCWDFWGEGVRTYVKMCMEERERAGRSGKGEGKEGEGGESGVEDEKGKEKEKSVSGEREWERRRRVKEIRAGEWILPAGKA